jgi:hypothetical protein
MTTPPDRPRLRPGLAAEADGDTVHVFDPMRIGTPVALTRFGFEIANLFDGTRTPAEIAADIRREIPDFDPPAHVLPDLAAGLDQAFLLDSPRFAAHVAGLNAAANRRPSCVGVYDPDPAKCRAQLDRLFTADGGPGLPGGPTDGGLRAVLVPHMDYGRGNVTYGWGFKELAEQTTARTFVVVATGHYASERFTLTRQNFQTPLGVAETDRAYIDRIVEHYGGGLFDDPLAHIPEHSIELEVVLLQHLFTNRGPVKIVPLLVGSFRDRLKGGDPGGASDIARMVTALQKAEAANPEPVCYVISGDLAHIGPKFGDKQKAAGAWLGESRRRDEAILRELGEADPDGFFAEVAGEGDRRRICGLSPTWLTLAVTRPRAGKVLHYQQFVHPEGHESVSFAAVGFYA